MMNPLQIIGNGGFGREVAFYAQRLGGKLPVIIDANDLAEVKQDHWTVIAVGHPAWREKIMHDLLPWGEYSYFLTIPDALSRFKEIGEGTIICPGVQITVDVSIGKHVIVNLNAVIGHDAEIGDFTTISPLAGIMGRVKIGRQCYVGAGAIVREGITICDNVILGAGAVVVKDITEAGIYVGTPAKKLER